MRFSAALLAPSLLVMAGCSQHNLFSPLPVSPLQGMFARDMPKTTGFKSLYSFKGSPDGQNSYASLIAPNGTLYGTTEAGGKIGYGSVFKMTTSGTEHVIHSFTYVGSDGEYPYASLVAANGTLYGTTQGGGKDAYGTVYKVTKSGAERVLYSFRGNPDGGSPFGSLIAVNGTLYGTTQSGGKGSYGTVYKVTTSGTERVLHSFTGPPDGANSEAGLIVRNGTLYGTTVYGGKNNLGSVFKVTTSGAEHVLYSFKGSSDGEYPLLGALITLNGTLYGTTSSGGTYGYGTVYKVTTSGVEHVLYSFAQAPDGETPYGGLVAVNGTLYGMTTSGGTYGYGVVFKISTAGVEKVLHSFTGVPPDGAAPDDGLVELNHTLYGTTQYGGKSNYGTVFKIAP